MQFLFAPVSHPRLYNISNFILTPRDWGGPCSNARAHRQYIARYRDFVISRDVHVAISAGPESEIANFPKILANFSPRWRRRTFLGFLHLKTIDHFASFFPCQTTLHGHGKFEDHSDNAHTVAILICDRPDSTAAFWHTFIHPTIGNVAGILGYQGFSTESRYDVAEN